MSIVKRLSASPQPRRLVHTSKHRQHRTYLSAGQSLIQSDDEDNHKFNTAKSYQKNDTEPAHLPTLKPILTPFVAKRNRKQNLLPQQDIQLLSGVYDGRPATVFFDYLPVCDKESRDRSRVFQMDPQETQKKPLLYRFTDKAWIYNWVTNTLKWAGLDETTTGNDYNLLWGNVVSPEFLQNFSANQRTRHFPGAWSLGRKDNLWRNVSRMRRNFGKEYEICPMTYVLPEDYKRFLYDREYDANGQWIIKPAAGSCGRGIKIIGRNAHINKKNGVVIQKYISKPHLIQGYKYDLRVYVWVTSIDPLRIYMFKDGLVRIATEEYDSARKNNRKRFIHLTNYSVQKRAPGYAHGDQDTGIGNKWNFSMLKQYFQHNNLPWKDVMSEIKDVIVKTMISAEPSITSNMMRATKHRNICFELFGFDIILDHRLKPWLLEVNVSPSLSSSSPLDKQIKTTLLCDTLNLIGIVPFNHGNPDPSPLRPGIRRKTAATQGRRKGRSKMSSMLKMSYDDACVLAECEDEYYRRGHFTRIFPKQNNVAYYRQFFEAMRYKNLLVWNWLQDRDKSLEPYFTRADEIKNV